MTAPMTAIAPESTTRYRSLLLTGRAVRVRRQLVRVTTNATSPTTAQTTFMEAWRIVMRLASPGQRAELSIDIPDERTARRLARGIVRILKAANDDRQYNELAARVAATYRQEVERATEEARRTDAAEEGDSDVAGRAEEVSDSARREVGQ